MKEPVDVMNDITTLTEQFPTATNGLAEARTTQLLELNDGDQFELRIAPVTKQLNDQAVRMLAYNGSIPGPTLRVQQGSELVVNVTNEGDLNATVHWHGLRLENRFDGTAETQQPMSVGESFQYRLSFPDPGVYWYHPHIREDYGQEMGLYGNIIVVPSDPAYWSAAHREMAITLDDILLSDDGIAPFKRSESDHTAMGRFGNVLLANGEANLSLKARLGEVVRFYLTNTANTRVFNLAFSGARMKLAGGDSGRYEKETFVDTVLIAPSERAVIDVLFDQPGQLSLEHRTPNHTYKVATINVGTEQIQPSLSDEFEQLRINSDLYSERERVTAALNQDPDKTISFVAEMDMIGPEVPAGTAVTYVCPMDPDVIAHEPGRCPKCGMKLLPATAAHADGHGEHHHESKGVNESHTDDRRGIEWEDDMVEVNRMTTPANMRWKLIDRSTGAEGRAIDWRFRVGDRVKIRLLNELDSDHPMHHPFHVHGAGRFLILSRDGHAEPNLVWKDTVLIPKGQTVDILLEITSPGRWMAHCHIAEHHEAGMMFSFNVEA
jgi:FtsP/CotA-like multicopper oxidase with cupredoxin domain